MIIESVELFTSELAACKQFYSQRLGLYVESEDAKSFSLRAGPSRLTFRRAEPGSTPTYHFAFNIPENRVPEAADWLESRGIAPVEDEGQRLVFFDRWNAHAVYFNDPAGNIVEFIGRHGLHNRSDAPFDRRYILSLNEVGIAVDDVAASVQALEAAFGIRPARDPSEEFAAVGDKYGLIILVRVGRVWFMSDQPARDLPLRVGIRAPREGRLALGSATITSTPLR